MRSQRPQHISARAPSTIVMVASSGLWGEEAGEVVYSSDALPACPHQVWVFLSTGWSPWEVRWAFQGGESSISGFSRCGGRASGNMDMGRGYLQQIPMSARPSTLWPHLLVRVLPLFSVSAILQPFYCSWNTTGTLRPQALSTCYFFCLKPSP